MSESIKLLPDTVANQIAAGEVVNRPASVIKEMMENAIDAQSSDIIVNFRDGGKELIQIIDNGKGMSCVDARMAFERHATSKIEKVDDIYSLTTFGFRGEALASIAAVSEVELTTKREEDSLATEICISGGKFKEQNMIQGEKGSKFLVKNLFYNVPARRRFLEKSTTEAKHITAEFQRVALCNPEVSFTLYNNDALLYKLPEGNHKSRIVALMGKNMANNLLEIKADTSIIKVKGYVGSPSSSKQNNKDQQFLFVNNRFFKSAYFHKAIIQAYDKLIPANTQPSYFIFLSIEPQRIDVNVHPQKTEVKFDDNTAIWQIINAAVRESLAKLGVVPMMDFDVADRVELPTFKSDRVVYREPSVSINPSFNPFITNDFDLDTSPQNKEDDYQELIMEYIEGEKQTTMDFDQQSVLGDILPLEGGKYFASTINSRLAIVDIKRAYSCVLYSRYKTMLSNGNSATQQLMFPLALELSTKQISELNACERELIDFGFEFSINQNKVEISGIPADFTNCKTDEIFCELIDMLSEQHITSDELRVDFLAKIMSKTSNIRALETSAIENLLRELITCEYINYTPQGQQVISYLDQKEIDKRLEK
ncbi:MAG: DNA mismatch repair endonuclease MutL [Rikenellaceae bacterium]